MGPERNRQKALRSKKRREQRSAELPRTSDCVICRKPADRSQACANCIPNGRDLLPYCSRTCRERDVIHELFCGSISSIDKKRPSEDHYLAAFFPCDADKPEFFWMHATYEDGCLEIQHDRPNMLEYIREFGESSLCHRVQAESHSRPNTFVAVTGERDAGETDPIPRKWINRSRLAFDFPGLLKHEFFPTLLYAVERNEQAEIIGPADISGRALYYVVASWCSAENQPVLATWFGSMKDSVPARLVIPWCEQQEDIGIETISRPTACLRDRPETTFPLAFPFLIGLPWYIRLPSCYRIPVFEPPIGENQRAADAKIANDMLEYLKYTLLFAYNEEIEGQKKDTAIGMRLGSTWPSVVLIHGTGASIPLNHVLAVGSYTHSTDSPTEEGFRSFYSGKWSTGTMAQNLPEYPPWDPPPNITVSWRQDQPTVGFWLAEARSTSLVPDLMAKMEDPFVPKYKSQEAEFLQRMGAEALLELSRQEKRTEATDEDAEGQGPETEAKDETADHPQSDTESETLRGSSDGAQSDNEDDKGQGMTDGDAEGRGQETEVQDGDDEKRGEVVVEVPSRDTKDQGDTERKQEEAGTKGSGDDKE
ncbi:hypothetical protein CMUS01_14465 [Colletotrichum musicola]|uniref:Suppressor of anucleate metulae protein B n=1 Tax=Colletotrichum musicola TaxID=2175873 RepID=A0A8H6J489_9PEZI|nr:hypothetical protein CMUS01_14465 [Colletotrichum musicola]